MQIDFGEHDVKVVGAPMRVHFFVAILGYSRRIFVKAYEHETQEDWLDSIEEAFHYYGSVPCDIVSDNARSLVAGHGFDKNVCFTDKYQMTTNLHCARFGGEDYF